MISVRVVGARHDGNKHVENDDLTYENWREEEGVYQNIFHVDIVALRVVKIVIASIQGRAPKVTHD